MREPRRTTSARWQSDPLVGRHLKTAKIRIRRDRFRPVGLQPAWAIHHLPRFGGKQQLGCRIFGVADVERDLDVLAGRREAGTEQASLRIEGERTAQEQVSLGSGQLRSESKDGRRFDLGKAEAVVSCFKSETVGKWSEDADRQQE